MHHLCWESGSVHGPAGTTDRGERLSSLGGGTLLLSLLTSTIKGKKNARSSYPTQYNQSCLVPWDNHFSVLTVSVGQKYTPTRWAQRVFTPLCLEPQLKPQNCG